MIKRGSLYQGDSCFSPGLQRVALYVGWQHLPKWSFLMLCEGIFAATIGCDWATGSPTIGGTKTAKTDPTPNCFLVQTGIDTEHRCTLLFTGYWAKLQSQRVWERRTSYRYFYLTCFFFLFRLWWSGGFLPFDKNIHYYLVRWTILTDDIAL